METSLNEGAEINEGSTGHCQPAGLAPWGRASCKQLHKLFTGNCFLAAALTYLHSERFLKCVYLRKMNPEALGGERSLPKKRSPSTAPLVLLLNPSTRGGGRELSARAPGISTPHGEAPTRWGLEVNRGSSELFSAPWCHTRRGKEVVGWGKSGVDSSCTQTLSA